MSVCSSKTEQIFLLGRDGLARKDPSLSLLDDFVQQLR